MFVRTFVRLFVCLFVCLFVRCSDVAVGVSVVVFVVVTVVCVVYVRASLICPRFANFYIGGEKKGCDIYERHGCHGRHHRRAANIRVACWEVPGTLSLATYDLFF